MSAIATLIVSPPAEALVRQLLGWVAERPRTYGEAMDAWRTSCPRLPVWEEANARGLVTRAVGADGAVVRATDEGRAFLARRR